MKLLKLEAEGLPLFEDKIAIDFYAESRISANEKHELINIFDNYFLNSVMAITGLNASGKTQVINLIAFVSNLLQARSINDRPYIDLHNNKNFLCIKKDEPIKLKLYYFLDDFDGEKVLCFHEIKIIRSIDEADSSYRYFIIDENILVKKTTRIKSKKDLFNFNEEKFIIINKYNRKDEEYLALSDDVSIINVLYKTKNISRFYCILDMLSLTNINLLTDYNKIPMELIRLLDPSIKKLEFNNKTNQDQSVSLQFVGDDEDIIINSPVELHSILSSGVIKGIGLYMAALLTLKNGGLMIVDELENHINRTIAMELMGLFLDHRTNKNGAVLIYSTHYLELLDIIPRNDSIYITNKEAKINIKKVSSELKRNDIKKSEQFIQGVLSHTVPKYSNINKLKRVARNYIEE